MNLRQPMNLQQPSLQMRLMDKVLRSQPRAMADSEAFEKRLLRRDYPQPAPIPDSLQLQVYISHERFGDHSVFTLEPKAGGTGWHILYLHGGAYVHDLISAHWVIIEQLIQHTGATVTVPIYPLAPEHTYREAHAFLQEVYRKVLERTPAPQVVFSGDSAGGGISLALAAECRDAGLPLPAHLILFSPCVDGTFQNPEAAALERQDAMLALAGLKVATKMWAGQDDPRTHDVSPINGELAGLPPTDIYIGTWDVLLPDVRQFAQKARTAGVQVRLHEYKEAFHVFVGATFTPEAQEVYRNIQRLLGTQEFKFETHGLAKLVSLPPARIALYLNERAQQRQGGPTGKGNTAINSLPWLAGLAALMLLRRQRSKRQD